MSKGVLRLGIAVLVIGSGVLSACDGGKSGGTDPKSRLSDYISQSFAVKGAEDRSKLAEYLTGAAKQRLTSWSDEQFQQAFVESKRQFVKLGIKEVKSVSDRQTNITYELTYVDQSKGREAKITNKKLCELVLEQGQWLISDVRNIKELVEYKNEMSLP